MGACISHQSLDSCKEFLTLEFERDEVEEDEEEEEEEASSDVSSQSHCDASILPIDECPPPERISGEVSMTEPENRLRESVDEPLDIACFQPEDALTTMSASTRTRDRFPIFKSSASEACNRGLLGSHSFDNRTSHCSSSQLSSCKDPTLHPLLTDWSTSACTPESSVIQ